MVLFARVFLKALFALVSRVYGCVRSCFLMFIQWLDVDEAAGEVHSFIAV